MYIASLSSWLAKYPSSAQRLLRDAPDGKFSTNVLWDRAIAEGRLYGVAFTGRWYEVGTPAHIRPTEEALKGG